MTKNHVSSVKKAFSFWHVQLNFGIEIPEYTGSDIVRQLLCIEHHFCK
jgi:hypothetical protein